LIGRRLKKRYQLRWIADFRDPWCACRNEPPYGDNKYLIERRWEKSVFRLADLVIANTQNSARAFKDVFPRSSQRIVVIPNGYDPLEPNNSPTCCSDASSFVLLHTGTIYLGRDPTPLAKALRQVSLEGLLHGKHPTLWLLGYCESGVREALQSRELCPWVKIDGSISHAESIRKARAADVLVLLDSPGRRIGVPAKLYEYIGVGRPILALAENGSDTDHVLRKSGRPFRIVPFGHTIDDLKEAIVDLAKESMSATTATRNDLGDSFTREANARALASVLTNLPAESQSGESLQGRCRRFIPV
jgi:glycosyltransferase involved in cell wall biosynthesis